MTRSPKVYFLFFISGISGLVHEIVWTRMLTLTFGHTVFSVSITLSAFMAGLGFGSYLWGNLIDANGENDPSGVSPAPLLTYGTIEALIFVTSAAVSLVLAHFADFYSWLRLGLPDAPVVDRLVKAVLAFVLMFVPTTLMGATLPIVSKYYVTDDAKLGNQVGYLYFINTLGAAAGCLLTGFVLVSHLGVLQTVLLAAGLNLTVGVGAIRIYQDSEGGSPAWFRLPRPRRPLSLWSAGQRSWMTIGFLCGFTALAYEVLWTRLLVFSMASTVYSLSMMLAVFLLGLALGSLLVVPLARRFSDPRDLLIAAQLGVGTYAIVCLFGMDQLLSPPWNAYSLQSPLKTLARYFKDSSALMLVPTLLLGMNFPLLIKIVAGDRGHVGRGTGLIYAANTLGAILGSLAAGFLFLPRLGTEKSLVLVATLNYLTAMALFRAGGYFSLAVRKGMTALAACAILYINMTLPGDLLSSFFMRDNAGQRDAKRLLFFEEGLTDTVAIFQDEYGPLDPDAKRLVSNGIPMSASNEAASRYMKLLAHLPILLSDRPDDVLTICFGTGQTTGAAGIHPLVKTVDSVELSPSAVHGGRVFARENYAVLKNPKVNIVIQDGRNFLLTTPKRYDVITGEPPPPRTAFTVNLYTREYYERAKQRLKPGGVFAQWVPLHSQSAREAAMHFRTFRSVFPRAMGWLPVAGEIILIGSEKPIGLDLQKIRARMEEPAVRKALKEIHIESPEAFLGNIWFLEDQLDRLGAGQPLITDNRPRIEFYLDYPGVIGVPDMEKFVFNRAPFAESAGRIQNLSEDDRERLRAYYDAMDSYQRGIMYGNRKQLLEAIALAGDGDLFRYHLQAGRGQIQRLVEQTEREPANHEPLLNLGHAYFQTGEYDKSAEFLNMALSKEPRQGYAELYLGYALLEMGRRDEAKKHFESAVKKDPRQLRAVMQEIGLIDLLGKLDSDPDNPGLMNAVAQFYNVKSDYRKSAEYSLKVLEKDPENMAALQNLVFSYLGLGEPGEVFDYGRRYHQLNPDDLHIQYILAEMYMKTLRYEEAIPYLKEILRKDDSYRDAQSLLNQCEAASVPLDPTG
ncbi:MAG: fused MFS/spermidine synthase [Nitrospinae bacterium]|nr:fused MFS/spermidine synthase [Nitrospinota bacterium]